MDNSVPCNIQPNCDKIKIYNAWRLSHMKKFISKLFITLTIICFIQVKIPYFHTEIPSVHHIGSIAPFNDIPVSGKNNY